MNSNVVLELINLFEFFLLGVLIAIIFDFFRAYRKFKKPTDFQVLLQDMLFFLITTIIVVIGIINILDSSIRFYIFIAVFSGIGIYLSLLSKFIISLYNMFFTVIDKIIEFITMPIILICQFMSFIYKKIQKICKKCCKKFSDMVTLLQKKLKKKKSSKSNKLKKAKKQKEKNKKERNGKERDNKN